jgi:lipopolysaccharide export system protein LptA
MKTLLPLALFVFATVARGVEPVQTVITGDALESESSSAETHSVFKGHVHVTATSLEVTCDELTVLSARLSDSTASIGQPTGLKHLLATGHVRLVQVGGEREATCDKAEVFLDKGEIVLTGNARVTDKSNGTTLAGEPLILKQHERQVFGKNVRLVLPAMKDLGFDKKKP